MNHLFFTTSCYYFTILVGWSPMFVATQKRSHCCWFTQVSGWICTTYNWTNHDKPSTHPAYFMPNFGAPSLNLPSRWFAKKCSRWDIYPLGEYIHLFIYLFIYYLFTVHMGFPWANPSYAPNVEEQEEERARLSAAAQHHLSQVSDLYPRAGSSSLKWAV